MTLDASSRFHWASAIVTLVPANILFLLIPKTTNYNFFRVVVLVLPAYDCGHEPEASR